MLPSASRSPYLSLIRAVWAYATPKDRRIMAGFYVRFLLAAAALNTQPLALGRTINALQKGGPDLLTNAAFWLAVYASGILVFWIFHGPARVTEQSFGFRIRQRFVEYAYAKVTSLPMAWHANHHSGDTIHRVQKASTGIGDFAQDQFLYLEMIISLIIPICVLLWICWPLAIIVVIGSGIIFTTIGRFDTALMTHIRAENEAEHSVSAGLFDYLSNISTVLTLRLEKVTQLEIAHRLGRATNIVPQRARTNETKWFVMEMLGMVVEFSVLFGYIWIEQKRGLLMIGTLVIIFQYMRTLNTVFFRSAFSYQNLMRYATNLEAIRPILAVPSSPVLDDLASVNWKKIEISGLTFSYEDEQHHSHTVTDLNFELYHGERVALIGASGSGKSTLLKLIRGLYQTAHGQVLLEIDGRIFDDLSPLYGLSTLAPQNPEIFENTIRYNITLGVERSDEDILEACACAAFTSVLAQLPNGLDTDIRERGVNLSGGQQQRLALARAIFAARDGSFLLLDEPTSSIDPATEVDIVDNLLKAFPEQTIIMAAHRLHLLKRFDKIIVMANGKIVETGSFAELLARSGTFARLWSTYTAEDNRSD